jgi:hypothetical protein
VNVKTAPPAFKKVNYDRGCTQEQDSSQYWWGMFYGLLTEMFSEVSSPDFQIPWPQESHHWPIR